MDADTQEQKNREEAHAALVEAHGSEKGLEGFIAFAVASWKSLEEEDDMSTANSVADERSRQKALIETLEDEFVRRYQELMTTAKRLENARRPTLITGTPDKLESQKVFGVLPPYYQRLVNGSHHARR